MRKKKGPLAVPDRLHQTPPRKKKGNREGKIMEGRFEVRERKKKKPLSIAL